MKKLLHTIAISLALGAGSQALAEAPIRIGLVAPFSGNYAIFGEGYERGIAVWHEMYGDPKVGNRKIEVKKIDERCDVNTGLAAYRREASDVVAIIGPSCSGVVRAIAPLATADKKPLLFLGHGAALTMGGVKDGYLFRISQPDELSLRIFGEFIIKKWKAEGKTKIASIHDTSVTFSKAGDVMKKAAADNGVELVAIEKFDLGAKDFTAQLLKVKSSGAQGVVITTYAADQGRLMRQMAEMKLGILVAGGVDSPYLASIEKEFVDGKVDILENMYFYSDYVQGEQATEVKKFDAAFRKKFNLPPLDINYEGWVALSLMTKALQTQGAADGGENLRKAIANVKLDLGGRTISFVENGDQATLLTYIGQIKKGNPELIQLIQNDRKSFPLAQ